MVRTPRGEDGRGQTLVRPLLRPEDGENKEEKDDSKCRPLSDGGELAAEPALFSLSQP